MRKSQHYRTNKLSFFKKVKLQAWLSIFIYISIILKACMIGKIFIYPFFILPIFVYEISLKSPSHVPLIQLFLFGFFHDALFQIPLGISSLTWILLYFFIVRQRSYIINGSFWFKWVIFTVLWLFFSCFQYLFMKTNHVINESLFLKEMLSQIVFFPLGYYVSRFYLSKIGLNHD